MCVGIDFSKIGTNVAATTAGATSPTTAAAATGAASPTSADSTASVSQASETIFSAMGLPKASAPKFLGSGVLTKKSKESSSGMKGEVRKLMGAFLT